MKAVKLGRKIPLHAKIHHDLVIHDSRDGNFIIFSQYLRVKDSNFC